MSDEWQTIKVKDRVYKELKDMGIGISKAVEVLVDMQKQAIENKIADIKSLGNDIAEILFKYGVFDIRFAGAGIQNITEQGDTLQSRGFVNIKIPNAEARAKIIELLKGGEK